MHRLTFANQLRGLAALCVVLSHLIGVYWGLPGEVAQTTATPLQTAPVPAVFALVDFTWFNFAPFGVGLFFLISGLVIPFSLQRHTRASFAAARLLRIYPTYIAALCLELAVLQANALYWNLPFPFTAKTVIANLLLLNSLTGQPSVDLVNWTLIVELKFYVIMALAAPLVRSGSLRLLYALAAALLAGNLALHLPAFAALAAKAPGFSRQMSIDSLFLIFMLSGTLFNFHARNLLPPNRLLPHLLALQTFFLLAWRASLDTAQFPEVTVNYLYATTFFALAYHWRAKARPNPLLDALAAISFPLYLLHSLIGYSVLKLLMIVANFAYGPALGCALVIVVGLATVLHRTIETGSIVLGRQIGEGKAFFFEKKKQRTFIR